MMIITLFLLFSMLAVMWFDVSRYLIPNWLVGLLLIVYPIAVWMSPAEVDWKGALLGMLIVFAAGYVIFALRWMGGGDIKLITVLALWVGPRVLPDFIFLFAIIGGVFAILLLMLRKVLPLAIKSNNKPLPRILRNGEPIAYGVAIAIGFLIEMSRGVIPVLSIH